MPPTTSPHERGDRLERARHPLPQVVLGGQLPIEARDQVGDRDLAREVDDVDAALGRDRVAVALGLDEEPGAVGAGQPDVLRADRANRVVGEQARARARGQVVELRSAMAWFADQAEQRRVRQKPRQDVVLDVVCDAAMSRPTGP